MSDAAEFTRTVRAMVAEGDATPLLRHPIAPMEPFSDWRIATSMPNGLAAELHGTIWPEDGDPAEWHRYVDGVADGLRRAGFEVEVTKTRTVTVGGE